MGHCSGYSAITRSYLKKTSWELRHRVAWNSNGTGSHNSSDSQHFNSTFASQCDTWANDVDYYLRNHPPASGAYNVDWFGNVGVGVCKSGMHGKARAYDLTHVRFSNGYYFDANWSWQQTTFHKRRYLAVWALCRRRFQTVISAYEPGDSAHNDHIHFDNDLSLTQLRTNKKKDVVLVQAACNFLNGESLSLDGVKGSNTNAAMGRLLTDFGLNCRDPFTSKTNMYLFTAYVAKHGFGNKAAGYYRYSGC